MIVKQISVILIFLLLAVVTVPFARAQTDETLAKVKAQAAKYGGSKKRVKVEMRLGYTQKGYISRTGADSFDLTNSKSGQVSTILYKDVEKIKKGGLSTTTIVTLAGLGAAAVIVGALVGIRCRNEGGC